MVILENIDIDKAILQNIDIDKISNRFKFGISNRARCNMIKTSMIMIAIMRMRENYENDPLADQ